ncbi:MAG: hypothetical protein JW798_08885 [Prolixibacteraceae bacterium]|nr:hypothetical protein [Prolixibacteraceae bacterium]
MRKPNLEKLLPCILVGLTLLLATFSLNAQEPVSGYIIRIKENKVYIDLTFPKVDIDTKINVIKEGEAFIHPVTKKEIKEEDEIIARLEVSDVKSDYSIARVVPSNALNLLKEGMKITVIQTKEEEKTSDNLFKKSMAIEPLTVSNIQGFLGLYVGDVLTEKMLAEDQFRIIDRQSLGLQIEKYLLNLQTENQVLNTISNGNIDYIISGTMYEPDVSEISSGIPLRNMVKVAGFAAELLTGEDLHVDAISEFVPKQVEMKNLRSVVKVTLKVIDAKTGEIVFLCTEMQEAMGLGEINLEGGVLGGLKLQGGATTFANTITGQATEKALTNLTGYINKFFNGEIGTKTYTGNIISLSAFSKDNKLKIISIEENDSGFTATLNKGSHKKKLFSNLKKGNAFNVYCPKYDTSLISGEVNKSGKDLIGFVTLKGIEHDLSLGKLTLNRTLPFDLIVSDNKLLPKPNHKKITFSIGYNFPIYSETVRNVDLFGFGFGEALEMIFEFDGPVRINLKGLYPLTNFYSLGLGTEIFFDQSLHLEESRERINPILSWYISNEFYLSQGRSCPFIEAGLGSTIYRESTILESTFSYYLGIGYKYYITSNFGIFSSLKLEHLGQTNNYLFHPNIDLLYLTFGFFF